MKKTEMDSRTFFLSSSDHLDAVAYHHYYTACRVTAIVLYHDISSRCTNKLNHFVASYDGSSPLEALVFPLEQLHFSNIKRSSPSHFLNRCHQCQNILSRLYSPDVLAVLLSPYLFLRLSFAMMSLRVRPRLLGNFYSLPGFKTVIRLHCRLCTFRIGSA